VFYFKERKTVLVENSSKDDGKQTTGWLNNMETREKASTKI